MNSLIRFRTGITLSIVAAATLVGCGDDDATPLPGMSDAGDAGVVASSGDTQNTSETPVTDVIIDPTTGGQELTTGLVDAGTEDLSDASTTDTSGDGTDVGSDASISTGNDTSVPPEETSRAPETSAASDETSVAPGTGTGAADSGVSETFSTGEGSIGPISDETADVTSTSGDSTETPPAPDWIGLEVGQASAATVSVEPQGNDGYLGVIYDAAGNFYAVGEATEAGGDSYMAVTKFHGNGAVDTDFGQNGVARKNVSVGGAESVRAITLQTTGGTTYLVVAGTAQFEPEAEGLASAERDVALVRFTLGGTVDGAFGDAGVVRLDLNTGVEGLDRQGNPAWVSNDAIWSIGTTMGDRLVIHGEQRTELTLTSADGGVEERSDLDWVLVRLMADGSPDGSFGDGGKVTLDLLGAGASARSASVLEDGSIIGTGYLTSDVLGSTTQQPVLYKVDAAGQFDASFASEDFWGADGVFHDFVVAPDKRAEAYGAVLQGNNLVTMGYGPTTGTGTGTDFVALRFTAEGVHDKTFGTDGVTYVDAAGQSDNGRSLVVLPDQTILGIGGGRRLPDGSSTAVSDGMLVLLSPNGLPIQSFGEAGVRLYELGGSNDFFWAGAVSPDQNTVAIVGIKGGTGEGDAADTDGAVLVLPLNHFSN